MTGRKPDLVCIGAQKAATSWLYQVCQARSDIWVPPFKEVHFFDYKFCPENRPWIRTALVKGVEMAARRHRKNQPQINQAYMDYLERLVTQPAFNGTWYKTVFSRTPEGQLSMDVTPEYSTLPQEGLDFLVSFLPKAQFIYVIRDPVERALSQLRMNLHRRKISPGSAEAWRRHARDPVLRHRGDYKTYIPRWDAAFGEDRLLYLPFGMVADDPEQIMRKLETFAGLKWENPWGLNRKFHAGKAMDIPQDVRDALREELAPQYAFLARRFPPEFIAQL